LSKVDADEKCALVHAAEGGHVSIVSFLLECVWSATGDTYRTTAIHRAFVLAAASGRTKVCEYLLDCADVSVETTDPVSGITALCAACSSAHSETVHFFLSRGAQIGASRVQRPPPPSRTEEAMGNSPLICAVASGSWDLVVSLLTRGLDVNEERTVDGFTPLMAAAHNGHIGVMELLLSRGALLDAVDVKGKTALAHACSRGQTSCASLLMDRGARVDMVDRDKNAVLHLAASKGSRSLVSRLLEHGAKLEEEDGSGMRPIDVAVKYQNTSALQCFLRRGAKLGGSTWELAKNAPTIALMLLQKLIEDGNLLYRRGRIKDAAHRFNYALRKCATMVSNVNMESHRKKLSELNCALLLGLARTKRRLGEFDGAVECCSEGLQLATSDEQRFEAHYLRAKCYFDAQDLERSRRDAQTAVQLRPTSTDARQLLQTLTMPTGLPSVDAMLRQQPPPTPSMPSDLLQVTTTTATVHPASESPSDAHGKSVSPADCSSDSGNQADYEDHRLLSPGRQSLDESEL
uniref:Uncharacterized protein n=1 Tax=Plectus sambesii TaxID=2011161 RepID=A0A914X836_9BILA